MLTPREKSPLPENVPRGGSNLRHCGQRAQALPTELFRPPSAVSNFFVVLWGLSHFQEATVRVLVCNDLAVLKCSGVLSSPKGEQGIIRPFCGC